MLMLDIFTCVYTSSLNSMMDVINYGDTPLKTVDRHLPGKHWSSNSVKVLSNWPATAIRHFDSLTYAIFYGSLEMFEYAEFCIMLPRSYIYDCPDIKQ